MIKTLFHKIADFLMVLRSTWFLLLLDILALFAFLMIAQGQDILLTLIEQTSTLANPIQLIGLLMAILFWSVAAEYGARMLVYLADNSGRSLDPARVADRKRYQLYISRIALFFPVVLMLVSFISVYITDHTIFKNTKDVVQLHYLNKGCLLIITLLVLEGGLLWYLYPGNLITKLSEKYKWLSWMGIEPVEQQWLGKLYGILNDVRVDIPATDTTFTDKDLPRDQLLPDGLTLPNSPYFVPFASNPQLPASTLKVWMFGIRIRFYSSLVKQLLILLAIAVGVIATIGFLFSVEWDIQLGATAIICLAFASWQIVYVFFHFLDKAQPIPIRFLLFILLIVCSFINHDHPVRILDQKARNPKMILSQQFDQWFAHVQQDVNLPYYYRVNNGSDDLVPVIFVSAEGGALRTGAFSGLLLAHLQDKFPMFKNYLYGYSSVSGGTVGCNFFNAQLIHYRSAPAQDNDEWSNTSKKYFKTDLLSAVTAKLVFSEVVGYFIPWHMENADRAIALEKGFEYGWGNIYKGSPNLLSGSFDQTVDPTLPSIFINTTEAETGLQNIWSNLCLDELPLANLRDLNNIQRQNIAYSSAINLSDRFPLISPAGCFFRDTISSRGADSEYRRHFVDGGYYENKGSETLMQVLKAINWNGKKIKPYVLQFNFSGDTVTKNIKKFNEISEIFNGLYNTRGGRGKIAEDALKQYVSSLHGVFIPLNLTLNGKQLPMNWVLSSAAVDRLDITVSKLVNNKTDDTTRKVLQKDDSKALSTLFFYDPKSRRKHN